MTTQIAIPLRAHEQFDVVAVDGQTRWVLTNINVHIEPGGMSNQVRLTGRRFTGQYSALKDAEQIGGEVDMTRVMPLIQHALLGAITDLAQVMRDYNETAGA